QQRLNFSDHGIRVRRIIQLQVNLRHLAARSVQVLHHCDGQKDLGEFARLYYAGHVPDMVQEIDLASSMNMRLLRLVGIEQNMVRMFKALPFAKNKALADALKSRV